MRYIQIEIQIHRDTDIQRNKQVGKLDAIDRQTDKQIFRQTDRDTDRQRYG